MRSGDSKNQPDDRKSHLSPSQRELLALMQRVQFGQIKNLPVKNGEPVLAPSVRVIRTVKIAESGATRRQDAGGDCALKCEVMIFFCQLRALGDGIVKCIEVKHGLPFLMQIEEPPGTQFIEDSSQA